MKFQKRGKKTIEKLPLCKYPNPITEEKKNNLLGLLPYIDEIFHDFYKNLPTAKDLLEILPDIEEAEHPELPE